MLWCKLPGIKNKPLGDLISFFFKRYEDDEILEMMDNLGESCMLDAIERFGECTLQNIGDILKITRERVRQIEHNRKKGKGAMIRLRHIQRSQHLEVFINDRLPGVFIDTSKKLGGAE